MRGGQGSCVKGGGGGYEGGKRLREWQRLSSQGSVSRGSYMEHVG